LKILVDIGQSLEDSSGLIDTEPKDGTS